jgi:hypothetical protein
LAQQSGGCHGKAPPEGDPGRLRRLAINAHNLLSLPVGKPSQDSRLGGSHVPAKAQDVPRGDAPLTETLQQPLTRLIITHNSHGQNGCSKRGDVARRVGATSGKNLLRSLLQDEHRRLARNARNLAVNKFVRDEVSKQDHLLARELLEDFQKSFALGRRHLHTDCIHSFHSTMEFQSST